jgi:predicted transcriptional regulator
MKTTIDLPDEMLRQVKVLAIRRKTTLKALVMQGLAHVTQSAASEVQSQRQQALERLVAGLQGTNSRPLRPLKRAEIYDR